MSIFTRIGATKTKYELDIIVHYVRINCSVSSAYQVEVERGSRKKQSTKLMLNEGEMVGFESPITFNITMYHKGESYTYKDLTFKLAKVIDCKKKNDGKVTIDIIPLVGSYQQIQNKVYPLKDCSDKRAVICVSVNLMKSNIRARASLAYRIEPGIVENFAKARSSLCVSNEPLVDTRPRSETTSRHNEKTIEEPAIQVPTKQTSEDTSDGCRDVEVSKVRPSRIYDIVRGDIHSKEDEEANKVREEVMLGPSSKMVDVRPNFNSKSGLIKDVESKAGIAKGRRGACNACLIF